MRLRGGEIWKEGADTCVFKPPVRCKGEPERTPGSVSRIVNTQQATRDIEAETLIRTKFPELVASEVVTVHTKACVPEYDQIDLTFDKTFQQVNDHGCDKLKLSETGVNESHTNMITPLRDITMRRFLRENAAYQPLWKSLINGILYAAITLVPDDGPWVIHTDCHLNNILTIPKGVAETPGLSLSDWGRALIIQTPKDIESVRQGIREWARSISYFGVSETTPDSELVRSVSQNIGDYPQHPKVYHNTFALVFSEDSLKQQTGLNKLRSWLPYVLITQTAALVQDTSRADWKMDTFRAFSYDATTQTELADKIYNFLYAPPTASAPPVVGGVYWPLKYYRGLTRKQNLQRKRSATRRTKMSFTNPKAYTAFKSDKGVKTRKSSYTERFHRKYPGVTSLPDIAKATGISKSVLDKVYDRGMAAWRTGHRPGASQQAWGMARVYSFVLHGKTWRTADKDLAKTSPSN